MSPGTVSASVTVLVAGLFMFRLVSTFASVLFSILFSVVLLLSLFAFVLSCFLFLVPVVGVGLVQYILFILVCHQFVETVLSPSSM